MSKTDAERTPDTGRTLVEVLRGMRDERGTCGDPEHCIYRPTCGSLAEAIRLAEAAEQEKSQLAVHLRSSHACTCGIRAVEEASGPRAGGRTDLEEQVRTLQATLERVRNVERYRHKDAAEDYGGVIFGDDLDAALAPEEKKE